MATNRLNALADVWEKTPRYFKSIFDELMEPTAGKKVSSKFQSESVAQRARSSQQRGKIFFSQRKARASNFRGNGVPAVIISPRNYPLSDSLPPFLFFLFFVTPVPHSAFAPCSIRRAHVLFFFFLYTPTSIVCRARVFRVLPPKFYRR